MRDFGQNFLRLFDHPRHFDLLRLRYFARSFAADRQLRLPSMLLVLLSAASAMAAQPGVIRPLPSQVVSQVPEMHPFGKGRHSLWGIKVYDATL